jgi:hypothetical protein
MLKLQLQLRQLGLTFHLPLKLVAFFFNVSLFINEHFVFFIQGLWAVVNNAGFSTFGEMEWVPINVYEMV